MGFKEAFKAQQERSRAANETRRHGDVSAQMVCPHCQTRGTVRTKQVKAKRGISGGKATAAVLTGGVSMLGTGLSRKERVTEARCGECGAVWTF